MATNQLISIGFNTHVIATLQTPTEKKEGWMKERKCKRGRRAKERAERGHGKSQKQGGGIWVKREKKRG